MSEGSNVGSNLYNPTTTKA